MGRGLVVIKDKYFEWSTVVDAPVSYAMTLEELTAYTKEEYGNQGIGELDRRIERCNKYGTSLIGGNPEVILSCNRAGIDECKLTVEQIYDVYQNEESYNSYFKPVGAKNTEQANQPDKRY